MGLFSTFSKKIEKDKASCNEFCERAEAFITEKEQILSRQTEFLDASFSDGVKATSEELKSQMKELSLLSRLTTPKIFAQRKAIEQLLGSLISKVGI